MSELDGLWEVRPLPGVRKRIRGTRGETLLLGGPGLPFDVLPLEASAAKPPTPGEQAGRLRRRGHELRYRAPFAFLVDYLEPQGDGWHIRATAFGRAYGEFELRRLQVGDMETQLVNHIDEAHALEQTVLRMLDGLIQGADDPEIVDRLEHHKLETQQHESLMRGRLEAHGATPSIVRQAAGMLEALLKMPFDLVRGERTGRSARDAYTTEHLEIASYELLRRVAERAGDEETARACLDILEQERAMAQYIEENWDRFAEQSLREEGVPLG